jgi:phage terminase large subunit-like protein
MIQKIEKTLLDYSNAVVGDMILSCNKHKQACARYLSDLRRVDADDSFPYVFVPEKAQLFLNWVSLFRHSKGVLADRTIELLPAIKFIVGNIYGWYDKNTGHRRFNKVYFQVGRKNMKSQLASLIALYELMAFVNGVSEVYTAATKKDQAKVVYDECIRMLRKSKHLTGKWEEKYFRLRHVGDKGSGSEMRALSQEDGKQGDGLNPQCAIIDEYHAHKNSEVLDIMSSAMGARPEPLLFIITTAGFDLSRPCYRIEYKLVSEILDPYHPTIIETYFCDIHELETNNTPEILEFSDGRKVAPGEVVDDPFEESNWPKANPVICSYPEGLAFLRATAKEAKSAPDKQRNFFTKHLNIWVNRRDAGYMPLDRWHACMVDELPEVTGKDVYIGADLAEKNDISSLGVIIPIGDTYVVKSYNFIPETKLYERMQRDNVPFDLWEKQGWLHVMPGEVINTDAVIEYVLKEIEHYLWTVSMWCFDKWHAALIMAKLEAEGHNVVEIRQGAVTLSEPLKAFRNCVFEKKIIHDGNPVLTWAMGNAVVEVADRNENIVLSKKKATERIDPVAAVINGFTRASLCSVEDSGYETSGLRAL